MPTQSPSFMISASGNGPQNGRSEASFPSLSPARIARLAESWLVTGDISRHSPRTTEARRDILSKLVWFLEYKGYTECGTSELRGFLQHATHGHKDPGGRWGSTRNRRPTKPRTVKNYHGMLRTFFNFVVAEGEQAVSPMNRIPVPVDRTDQVKPFEDVHLTRLLAATKKTLHPRRDEAIVLLLLDTGMRASELCGLCVRDIDFLNSTASVEGKGGKQRHLPFCREVKKAMLQYLGERETTPEEPVFLSDQDNGSGPPPTEPLTRHGLRFLIYRLGKTAGIEGVRVSPHTFRHTFAISFLRSGGNSFTLQQMLGHTNLTMTQRYVAIAEADIANQHRQHSPVARLKATKGK